MGNGTRLISSEKTKKKPVLDGEFDPSPPQWPEKKGRQGLQSGKALEALPPRCQSLSWRVLIEVGSVHTTSEPTSVCHRIIENRWLIFYTESAGAGFHPEAVP